MNSLFCCPVCGGTLTLAQNGLRCPEKHCFDKAHEGYVHLLPASQMHTKIPGDNKEMVAARRSFLQTGGYEIFSNALNGIVCGALRELKRPAILDAGCGEGYYTARLAKALTDAGKAPHIAALDISKFAVKAAAKTGGDCIEYAVASSFHMPLKNVSFDAVINIFSPMVESEFARVLKKDGLFVFAVPGPRHLFGLKEVLYEKPYENTQQNVEYKGFRFEKRLPVQGKITVTGDQIMQLFAMTPYFWKTSKEGAEKLAALDSLTTEIHFDFLVFRRK